MNDNQTQHGTGPSQADALTEAFAATLTYTVTDGFSVPQANSPQLFQEMHKILQDAQTQSSVQNPHVPTAALIELREGIYSEAFLHGPAHKTPNPVTTGAQGTLDDWAWLITDSIEKAYGTPSINRVYFHARITQLLTHHTNGISLYLPAAIRQRLASTKKTGEEQKR